MSRHSMYTHFAVFVIAFLIYLTHNGGVLTFSIVESTPGDNGTVKIKEGESFEMWCNVDQYWEWCTFKQRKKPHHICDLEWIDPPANVTVLDCKDFEGRMEFIADYDSYECGIRIYDARPEDAGMWSCNLENYYRGRQRKYGYEVNREFNVEVELKPTTTTTTTSTTTTTTERTSTNAQTPDGASGIGNGKFSSISSDSQDASLQTNDSVWSTPKIDDNGSISTQTQTPSNSAFSSITLLVLCVSALILVFLSAIFIFFVRKHNENKKNDDVGPSDNSEDSNKKCRICPVFSSFMGWNKSNTGTVGLMVHDNSMKEIISGDDKDNELTKQMLKEGMVIKDPKDAEHEKMLVIGDGPITEPCGTPSKDHSSIVKHKRTTENDENVNNVTVTSTLLNDE